MFSLPYVSSIADLSMGVRQINCKSLGSRDLFWIRKVLSPFSPGGRKPCADCGGGLQREQRPLLFISFSTANPSRGGPPPRSAPRRCLEGLGSSPEMAMKAPATGLTLRPSLAAPPPFLAPSRRLLVGSVSLKTSFFNGGVRSMRIQISNPNRLMCGGHGGGALGAQMNLFDRLARVIRSYANSILSSVEDPEKILEQAVLEMNDDLTKMRQATAQVLASQKRLENKYKAAQQASDDWYRRAQLALAKGDEDLAREALKRRKSYADNASSLKAQLDQQKGVVENLVSNTRLLESKIQEARSKKDTLKARAQSARTATKVSEMLGNVNTSSALSAFEKMEEKVMAMESQAEALNQLTSDDLEGKFALLESSSVDDDLANLKRELSGSSLKGELPAGRTVSSSNTSYPFRDIEIEKELNELRRKTKEY